MTDKQLPVIGAAIRLAQLEKYIDWLAADQRDLEIQDPCYPHYLDNDWKAEAEAGRALLTAHNYSGRIGIHAAYDGLDLFTQDRKLHAVIEERYLQSLAFGEVLGATHMVIHSPFVTFGSGMVNYTPYSHRKPVIDIVHKILENVLPVAERMKCVLVIECILDKSPLPLVDLVRSFNSEYVRLSIDTGHAFVMAQDGGTLPHQWVVEAGELLGHIHVQDVDGHADRHWPVGIGNINWPAFFHALSGLNHQPRMVLEVEAVTQSYEWLVAHKLAR